MKNCFERERSRKNERKLFFLILLFRRAFFF